MKRFPSLQSDIATSANDSLEKFRDESRKTVLRLVEMESTYLTVEFFRKLHLEQEKNTNAPSNQPNSNSNANSNSNLDRFTENHLRRIGEQFAGCFDISCTIEMTLISSDAYKTQASVSVMLEIMILLNRKLLSCTLLAQLKSFKKLTVI